MKLLLPVFFPPTSAPPALHSTGFGIACHLGVLTGLPCIGVAKNLLQVEGLANDELHKKQVSVERCELHFTFLIPNSKGCGGVRRTSCQNWRSCYVQIAVLVFFFLFKVGK